MIGEPADDVHGKKSALDRIRTYDLLLRRQTLYPLSYEGTVHCSKTSGRKGLMKLSREKMAQRNTAVGAREMR